MNDDLFAYLIITIVVLVGLFLAHVMGVLSLGADEPLQPRDDDVTIITALPRDGKRGGWG